jgi:hypothetical protein
MEYLFETSVINLLGEIEYPIKMGVAALLGWTKKPFKNNVLYVDTLLQVFSL